MTGCRGQVFISLSPGVGRPRYSRSLPIERGLLAHFQRALGIQDAVELDELGDESGPARLVTGAQPGAVVAVEVLVEEDVVAPMRIGLELLAAAVDRAPAADRRG